MKIGMFTSGYQRNPLEHCFQDARRFGYDFIELWGGRPHAYAPDLKAGEIEDVKRLIEQYEMPVLGYTPEHNAYPYNFMIGSELQRRDAVAYLKLCLDMAKELGADYMLVSPAHAGYQADYEEIWSRMEKTIRELGEHAEKKEVKLVVETLTPYESNAFKSANDAAELFKRIDSPYVVGMCDLVPPYVQHESIMAYLDKLGDKMYHFHIIDGEQGTDSHIVPGEGSIPLKELFMELKEAGYQGTATLELVTGYINEPRLYARRAVSQARAYMKEAGF
ncbi:MAG: fructoselysine 3-epimerase [Ruminococcus sp.]|jgi:Sugar phosphate isomerases/epimerases|uniref:Fructoselysine 3-epimerase n=1 Tax=Schaedlerella arabinosiphila TaxID=2044587 RepID=A0A426DDA3_9FIRM|nr:fructoselysine 3-epimerase [Schaedlerella arabinosiphila]MCI8723145.1 fructoselysine 3-epimerase [Ruminococcus sp.]MCI9633455.1 fructoselysine 3-epimerase [Ruminococcus sp.]RRK30704.1 fructoselysine 3-epimerase [Schaedlerella arabinosiphila]